MADNNLRDTLITFRLCFFRLPPPSGRACDAQKTVWEELKEVGTGQRYYFSSVSQSSQWDPPVWVDYVDTQVRRCGSCTPVEAAFKSCMSIKTS